MFSLPHFPFLIMTGSVQDHRQIKGSLNEAAQPKSPGRLVPSQHFLSCRRLNLEASLSGALPHNAPGCLLT